MNTLITLSKSFFISVIAFALIGCEGFTPVSAGGDDLGSQQVTKPYGTCDRKAVSLFNLCTEVVGTDYNDNDYLDVLQSNCEATGGIFSTAVCDRTGSLGTCVIAQKQSNEAHTTYYPPQYSAEAAQMDCESNGGEFAPNP